MADLTFGIDSEYTPQTGVDPEIFIKTALSKVMTPEEQADIPLEYAKIEGVRKDAAEGKIDPRTKLYTSLIEPDDSLAADKKALLEQMKSDQPMSKSQVAAMMMIGILPLIAGFAIKGKKGLAAGADAASVGVSTLGKALDEDNKNKKAAAVMEYRDLQEQEKDQKKFQQQVELENLKSMDTAEQKRLDRENNQTVAGIRAGGDAAVSKSLGDIAKELENNRKQSEKSAREEPITIDKKVYFSNGSATDEDRKVVRELTPDFKTATNDLKELYHASKNMDLPAIERAWKDDQSELALRRKRVVNSLQRIYEVPGRGGEFQAKRIEAMIENPQSFWRNIISQAPGKTGIPDALQSNLKLLNEQIDAVLTSKGHNIVLPVGEARKINGQIQYFIGVDAQGNPQFTTDKDKVQLILDKLQ